MQDQIEFIDGLFAKAPHPNAPDFIKANISIKREEMLNWLSARSDEWINIDVKEARSGTIAPSFFRGAIVNDAAVFAVKQDSRDSQ